MTGQELKKRLKELGITREEFSKISGFSKGHIDNMCAGFCTVSPRIVAILNKEVKK